MAYGKIVWQGFGCRNSMGFCTKYCIFLVTLEGSKTKKVWVESRIFLDAYKIGEKRLVQQPY